MNPPPYCQKCGRDGADFVPVYADNAAGEPEIVNWKCPVCFQYTINLGPPAYDFELAEQADQFIHEIQRRKKG